MHQCSKTHVCVHQQKQNGCHSKSRKHIHFPKGMETMGVRTRLRMRGVSSFTWDMRDEPGQRGWDLVPSMPPGVAGLWANHLSCRDCGADGRRARQSLVAAQATLADGAPGEEVGHT